MWATITTTDVILVRLPRFTRWRLFAASASTTESLAGRMADRVLSGSTYLVSAFEFLNLSVLFFLLVVDFLLFLQSVIVSFAMAVLWVCAMLFSFFLFA